MDNFVWNPKFNEGRHQFKVGGEFRRYFYHLLFDTSARGIWNFNGSSTDARAGAAAARHAFERADGELGVNMTLRQLVRRVSAGRLPHYRRA